jgi:hypothetical protein
VAVRAVIGRARAFDPRGIAARGFGGCLILLAAGGAALIALGTPLESALLALAPGGLTALTLSLLRVSLRHLRRVGWTLLGASLGTLAVLVTRL